MNRIKNWITNQNNDVLILLLNIGTFLILTILKCIGDYFTDRFETLNFNISELIICLLLLLIILLFIAKKPKAEELSTKLLLIISLFLFLINSESYFINSFNNNNFEFFLYFFIFQIISENIRFTYNRHQIYLLLIFAYIFLRGFLQQEFFFVFFVFSLFTLILIRQLLNQTIFNLKINDPQILELKKKSQELSLSQSILNSLNIGIFSFSQNKTHLVSNPSFHKFIGSESQNFTEILNNLEKYQIMTDLFRNLRKILRFKIQDPRDYSLTNQKYEKSSGGSSPSGNSSPFRYLFKEKIPISENRNLSASILNEKNENIKQIINNYLKKKNIDSVETSLCQNPVEKSYKNILSGSGSGSLKINKNHKRKMNKNPSIVKRATKVFHKNFLSKFLTSLFTNKSSDDEKEKILQKMKNATVLRSFYVSKETNTENEKIWNISLIKFEENDIFMLTCNEVLETIEINKIMVDFKETQSKLLASLSHELRTPLNSTLPIIKEIKNKLPDDYIEKLWTPLFSNYTGLNFIVNDLLDFSEITLGNFKLGITIFNLQEVLTDCLNNYKEIAKKKNINLDFRFDENIGNSIKSDKTRILQILSNLMSNAIKYTKQGFIILRANLFLKNFDSTLIEISIQDSGCGIDEGTLRSLGTIAKKKNTKLAGLGLTISDYLAKYLAPKNYGGIFTKTSEQNKGAIFSFLIENKENELNSSSFSNLPKNNINNNSIKEESIIIWGTTHKNSDSMKFEDNEEKKDDNCENISLDQEEIRLPYYTSNYLEESNFKNKFKRKTNPPESPQNNNNLISYHSFHNSSSINSKNNLVGLNSSSINSRIHNNLNNNQPDPLSTTISNHQNNINININRTSSLTKLEILEQNIIYLKEKASNKACNCPDILIADDSMFSLIAFRLFLESFSLKIDTADNGENAIIKVKDLFDNSKCKDKNEKCKIYKCIFMDLDMPYKDGFQASIEILEFALKNNIEYSIIAWSAFNDQKTEEKCKEIGMCGFVGKPHDITNVKRLLIKKVLPKYD